MPRDFKSFAEQTKNNTSPQDNEKINEYQNILDKYKDMDQNSLMSNLFSEASKLKKEGKLDKESLNSMKTSLAPFLNEEQKQMLNQLVNAINEQK